MIALVVAGATPPSIATTALIGAVPLALGALAMAVFGVETRRRRLEDITAEELQAAVDAGAEAAGRVGTVISVHVIAGEDLAPIKARILLMVALTHTQDLNELRRIFSEY